MELLTCDAVSCVPLEFLNCLFVVCTDNSKTTRHLPLSCGMPCSVEPKSPAEMKSYCFSTTIQT